MSSFDRPGFERAGLEARGFGDQLSIETPEQVELRFPVAGLGSRFVALLLDHLIQVGTLIVLGLIMVVVVAATGRQAELSTAGKWFFAFVGFVLFLLYWGYFALFEAFWHGQTPGKRAMQLRVIKDAGRQITLFESLARNLLRAVDSLPSLYLAGVITMLCNKRNKRLGDLAAGTLVVHERTDAQPLLWTGSSASQIAPLQDSWRRDAGPPDWQRTDLGRGGSRLAPMFPADALSRLSGRDLQVIEAFFARALDLPLETRAAMAYRITAELTAKMGVGTPEGNPERALEAMASQLRTQGRRF